MNSRTIIKIWIGQTEVDPDYLGIPIMTKDIVQVIKQSRFLLGIIPDENVDSYLSNCNWTALCGMMDNITCCNEVE